MASSHVLCFTFLFSLLALSLSSTTSTNGSIPTSITIPLSRLFANHPSSDPYQTLHLIASASVHRALNLKHPKSKSKSSTVKTPLFPRSYGGYSVDLSFGNPSQTIPFVFDTGSSLVWFPCTSRYLCSSCSFPNVNSRNIHAFIPRNSSTSKILGCKNPKCEWIFGQHVQSRCTDCSPDSNNCKQACPGYAIQYGLGSTAGILLLENLVFPERTVPDFLVGCSLLSFRQPSGIVGFGRGPQSLPAQMGLKKFSYCLLSHRYDDLAEISNLVLESESSGDTKSTGLSYAPFLRNPGANHSAFQEYYYVALKKIIVGDKPVKIPYQNLIPSSNGDGGVIVDSGTTFTYMEGSLLDAVTREFEKQMSNYTRAKDIETRSGLSPCFDVSKQKRVNIPELTFVFKGGAKMVLPSPNYFSSVGGKDVLCLTIVSGGTASDAVLSSGPAIILGNYQQQNFYIEYDLENDRFGFQPRTCKTSP